MKDSRVDRAGAGTPLPFATPMAFPKCQWEIVYECVWLCDYKDVC